MSWDSEHFDPLPPPPPIEPPPQPQKHWLKRLLAPLSGIALLIWKVAGPLLLALKNVKLFAFSLTFLVSLAAYTSIWGWRFALGFMLLLMVHEMGHVIQLRREGVPASAPMFIPFMGAFVGMKEMPKNAWAEAKVGLAGPVLGTRRRGRLPGRGGRDRQRPAAGGRLHRLLPEPVQPDPGGAAGRRPRGRRVPPRVLVRGACSRSRCCSSGTPTR